jgi:hypothetical protein
LTCCGPNDEKKEPVRINNCYLLGSPFGFGINWIFPFNFRSQVIKHLVKYSNNFYSTALDYFWSEEDLVSKKSPLDNKMDEVFDQLFEICEETKIHHSGTDHDSNEYLDILQDFKAFG